MQNTFKPAKPRLLFALLALALCIVLGFTLLFRHTLRSPARFNPAYTQQAPTGFYYEWGQTISGGALTLWGWACIEGERILEVNTWVVLHDIETGEYLRLPTTMELDSRPNEVVGGDILYDRGGFVSVTPLNKLDSPLSQYEVCIAYGNNGHNALMHTGQRLGAE